MRTSTIHSLVIWLCLLSFGMDITAHAITHGSWGSSNSHHGHSAINATDHDHAHAHTHALDHATTHDSPSLKLSPADHLNHHNQPIQNDRPTDTDHDQTHHLSIQLRFSTHSGPTLYPIDSLNTQLVLLSTTPNTHLDRAPDRSVLSDTIDRLRTVKMTV